MREIRTSGVTRGRARSARPTLPLSHFRDEIRSLPENGSCCRPLLTHFPMVRACPPKDLDGVLNDESPSLHPVGNVRKVSLPLRLPSGVPS